MFIIIFKDGRRTHTYNENDIVALNWSEVSMVINMDNMDDAD